MFRSVLVFGLLGLCSTSYAGKNVTCQVVVDVSGKPWGTAWLQGIDESVIQVTKGIDYDDMLTTLPRVEGKPIKLEKGWTVEFSEKPSVICKRGR